MTNIQELKNQLQTFQEGIDYTYDESKKTYIIRHEELKNAFWGDASNEVEYKAIEDSRGNIHFQKSATFRSSKTIKKEEQTPFVHSVEKMKDRQWQEKNLGTFPEKTPPVLLSVEENNKDRFREPVGFEGIKEEFGYYREWKPNEEPTNTVYHKKREGDIFVERKKVWKDGEQVSSINNPQIVNISDNTEIEDTEMTEVESYSQAPQQHQQQQTENNSQQQEEIQQPPYKWNWE